MGFLRRLLGSSDRPPATVRAAASTTEADAPSSQEVEAEYERELLRGEHERLDELRQRQLRYAEYAWEPPAQGGARRADDGDAERSDGS